MTKATWILIAAVAGFFALTAVLGDPKPGTAPSCIGSGYNKTCD